LERTRYALSRKQEAQLAQLHNAGTHTTADLAELFKVGRSTVYRALDRERARAHGREAA